MKTILCDCRLFFSLGFWLLGQVAGFAQVSITTLNTPRIERFNSMGATGTAYPAGWTAIRYAGSGTLAQPLSLALTAGSHNSGNIYNVGAASAADRALGSLASGSTVPRFGIGFRNNTGQTVSGIALAGVMEQWRTGSSSTVEKCVFAYSLSATGIHDAAATWVSLPAMNLVEKLTATTTAGPVNGNLTAHRTQLQARIAGLQLAPGALIWLRWSDSDAPGSDALLALDDFRITLQGGGDQIPPGLAANPFLPADEAVNVPAGARILTITFNEVVRPGTGNIVVSNITDNTRQLLAVGNAGQVSFSGTSLSLRANLVAAKSYALQVPASAIEDLAGNTFTGFQDNATWNFRTAATKAPQLTVQPGKLDFGSVALQQSSASQSFVLSASNLTAGVSLASAAPFGISRNRAGFSQSVSFTAAELSSPQTVYVAFSPVAAGPVNGAIQVSSPGATARQVVLTGKGYEAFQQDFASCQGSLPAGWIAYSVAGEQVWACSTFGRSNNGVQITGFSGFSHANEDWLLTPALDLTGFDFPLLEFWSRSRFAGEPLRLMVSVDYSGSGDPRVATWTEIKNPFAPVNSDVWQQALVDLSAFEQPRVFLAFVYTSTTAAASRWSLDDFSLRDAPTGPFQTSLGPLTDLDFGTVLAPGESAARSFTFSVAGLDQDLLLRAPTGFVVSKNGTSYAASLNYTPPEAAAGNTVYLKFKPPGAGKRVYAGPLNFISGSELHASAGYAWGTTVLPSETFDVVNWNIEWFGAPNGPDDDALQLQHVKRIITHLDAEVYVLQEIANQQAFRTLLSQLPGYKGFTSPYYSASGSAATAQRLAFIYKTAAVDSVAGRGLLTKGTYPAGFWASGRLPYLFIFDARVPGGAKRIHLVNIHPKANENRSAAEAQEAYDRRRYDLQVLKDSLDRYYSQANIIVAGDFNDDLDFTVANISSTSETTFKAFMDDTTRYQALTLPLSQAGLRTYIGFDHVIDHVLISNELTDAYLDRSARVVIPFNLVSDYRATTSDHLPVSTRFLFTRDWVSGYADPLPPGGGLQIGPNPAYNWLRVSLPGAGVGRSVISLYDLTGRQVLRQVVDASTPNLESRISVGALPRRPYLLVVTTPGGMVRQKVVLQ